MTTKPKRGRPPGLVPGSRADCLLTVARRLSQPFTREALTVFAFHARPDLFGMVQHDYPDALRVAGILNSLVKRGYIERAGVGQYRVKE